MRLKVILEDADSRPLSAAATSGANQQASENGSDCPSSSSPSETGISSTETQVSLSTTPTEERQSRAVQDLLAERRARMEAKEREDEAAMTVERAAKAAARREASEAATPSGSKQSADMKYALLQKKLQQDARDERARILKRVEEDKAERREREALRAQARATAASSSSSTRPSSTTTAECALQIRLFDGTTIRSRFPSSNTLRGDVRKWIDGQHTGGGIPYTFKEILTPQPNRTISISEEEGSLQSVGLTPSATLILVPIKGYTSAYVSGTSGLASYVSKGISVGYDLVSSGFGLVTGGLSNLLGNATIPQQTQQNELSSPTVAPVDVRTLRDHGEDREDHQLYNGNALNFEPRRQEDKEE